MLAALLIAGMCVLTGCKDDQITEIFIASTDMPRLEYVEGQDLELGLSRLTVIRGDEEGSVPLTDSAVTISGYDKNVAGEQVVTIGYGGLTTTIKVTVYARAVAENYEISTKNTTLLLSTAIGKRVEFIYYGPKVNKVDEIFNTFSGAEAEVETDLDNMTLKISGSGQSKTYSFNIGKFDLDLVKAGGWVAYADKKY